MIKMQDQEKNLSHLPKVSADNKAKSISTSVEIENSIIVNKIQNMQYAKSKLGFGVRLYTGSKPQRTAGKTLESVPSFQVLKLNNHIVGFPNPNRNFFGEGRRGRVVGYCYILLQSRLPLPDDRCNQGGRTWQPFVGGKKGHENFCQARFYNFRDKCVVFARILKFSNLTR